MVHLSSGRSEGALIKPLIIGAFIVVVLAVLAFWGGMPSASELPKFLIGLIILLVLGVGIGVIGWILLFRPVPFKIVAQTVLSPALRQVMGGLLVVSMLLQMIGGVWDETWHEVYGIPFGKDFFWRPHILIYAGLMLIVVMAGIGWVALMRRATGNIVQRFRAEPILGMLVLTGVFLLYAIPADPVWHGIYGSDLSALSIPHVLILMLLFLTCINGVGLVVTGSPMRTWRSIFRFRLGDVVPVIAFASILNSTLLLLTVDWYNLNSATVSAQKGLVFQRPDWVLPVIIVFVATWMGTLANRSLRTYGAATLIGVVSFLFRLVLVNAFENVARVPSSWLLCLPPMLLIDLFYAWRVRRDQPVSWWMAAFAGAFGLVIVLPLINQLFLYPHVEPGNMLLMIVMPILASIMGCWLGQIIGDYLASSSHSEQTVTSPARSPMVWFAPGILVLTLVFVVWFVVTATPPVL